MDAVAMISGAARRRWTKAALLAGLAISPVGAWAQQGALSTQETLSTQGAMSTGAVDANTPPQPESFNDNIDPKLRLGDRETVGRDISSTLRIDEDERNDISLRRAASLRPESRMRGETVLGRARPAYDPIGLHAGSFTLFPEVGARAYATNNIYRQSDGVGDIYGAVRGAMVARSDWSRHQLILSGNVDQSVYAKYTTENALTYGVSADGRFDVDHLTTISGGASFAHDIVDRGASNEILQTRRPVQFDRTLLNLAGTRQFGRINMTIGGEYMHTDFQDAETPDGLFLSQQYRSFDQYAVKGRLGYDFPAGQEVFVSLSYGKRDFATPPLLFQPDRDVRQWEGLVGLASEITPLLRGHIGVGYVIGDFVDPNVTTRKGLAVDTELTYLYSDLTTFTLTGRRTIRNAAAPAAPAAFVTAVQLRVDHEYLRNLILSLRGGYERSSYISLDADGSLWNVGFDARWLVDRHLRITGGVNYRNRGTDGFAVVTSFSNITGNVGVSWLF